MRDVLCLSIGTQYFSHPLQRRIALAVFVCVVGPFGFCNVTKTKYLQILTTLMRWAAFGFMITLACIRLGKGYVAHPPVAR